MFELFFFVSLVLCVSRIDGGSVVRVRYSQKFQMHSRIVDWACARVFARFTACRLSKCYTIKVCRSSIYARAPNERSGAIKQLAAKKTASYYGSI